MTRLSLLVSHRLSQLLPRPLRRRMGRHVKVNQSTAVMFDDDEHVQDSERAGHRDTEITGYDRPRMIAKEGRPPLIPSGPTRCRLRHVLRHRARRHSDIILDTILRERSYFDQMAFRTYIYEKQTYLDIRSAWTSVAPELRTKFYAIGRLFGRMVIADDEALQMQMDAALLEPIVATVMTQ